MGNSPILASGPDMVRLQLYSRTQSEQHQMASVNSLDVKWLKKKSLCTARYVAQQKRVHVPRTRLSCRSIVPQVQIYVDAQFGQR